MGGWGQVVNEDCNELQVGLLQCLGRELVFVTTGLQKLN